MLPFLTVFRADSETFPWLQANKSEFLNAVRLKKVQSMSRHLSLKDQGTKDLSMVLDEMINTARDGAYPLYSAASSRLEKRFPLLASQLKKFRNSKVAAEEQEWLSKMDQRRAFEQVDHRVRVQERGKARFQVADGPQPDSDE